MSHEWNTVGPKQRIDEVTYVLTVDGERVAAVWWLGGHVERPDGWHITFRPTDKLKVSGSPGFGTAEEAKRYAEEVVGVVTAAAAQNEEIVVYFVARKDLKMSPGKLAAQVGHAVQYLMEVLNRVPRHADRHWSNIWRDSPSHTKIVLAVNSEDELTKLHLTLGIDRCVIVIDEGRTEIAAKTKTVVGLVPMPKSVAKPFVGHLPLY